MTRVVLDTNVFISALVFGGKPRMILQMTEAGAFELAVSQAIRMELEKILRQKFGWPQDYVAWACQPIWDFSHSVVPQLSVAVCPDPDDNRILECALEARAQAIVTGDTDLLRLSPFEGIAILTPAAFLAAVR